MTTSEIGESNGAVLGETIPIEVVAENNEGELVIPVVQTKLPFEPVEKFTPKHLLNYSRLVLWGIKKALALKNGELQPGDPVVVVYDWDALDLGIEMMKAILGLGLNPIMRAAMPSEMEAPYFMEASKEQLLWFPQFQIDMYMSLKARIFIDAPKSYNHLENVPEEKFHWLREDPVRRNLSKTMQDLEEQGKQAWTLASYPTKAQAEESGLSLAEYNGQMVEALFLNSEDPVAIFEANFQRAGRIKKYLDSLNQKNISHINFRSASGKIDLNAPMDSSRKWDGFSGNNIPSFELFTSPDFRRMNGMFYSDVKIFDKGVPIQGVTLVFKDGLLTEATAEVGNDHLQEMLKTDGMKACGEIALIDKDFSRIYVYMGNPLWDENRVGETGNGSCHIALGTSFFECCYTGDPEAIHKQAEADVTEQDESKRQEAVNNEAIKLQKELGFNFSMSHVDWINTEGVTATAHFNDGSEITIFDKGNWIVPEDFV